MRRIAIGLSAAALALPAVAIAGDWAAAPTPEQMRAAYPPFAMAHAVEGRVTLACEVAVGGALRACKAESETPPGFDFAAAALVLTPAFRAAPDAPGLSPGAAVRIPIHFQTPGAPTNSPEDIARLKSLAPGAEADLIWVELPTLRNVFDAYPVDAINAGKGGDAVLACRLMVDGRLQGCRVLAEDPASLKFGHAALQLTRYFRAHTLSRQGVRLAGAEVVFPVRFAPLQ